MITTHTILTSSCITALVRDRPPCVTTNRPAFTRHIVGIAKIYITGIDGPFHSSDGVRVHIL